MISGSMSIDSKAWGAIQTDVAWNKYVGWVEQPYRETQRT